jgi:hypothetical protein
MPFKELHLVYSKAQREEYRTGTLWKRWIDTYPQIYGVECESEWWNHQFDLGYGYFEMLTAILIHHATGYLCLGSYFKL